MEHTWNNDVNKNVPTTYRTNIVDLTFMDDTTWINSSQSNIEMILSIADSFYKLNNILINHKKVTILTNNDEAITSNSILSNIINLTYNNIHDSTNTTVSTKAITKYQSTRILRV